MVALARIMVAGLIIIAGCTYPISKQLRSQVNPELTFLQVIKDPQAFLGEKIILGGVIVKTRNLDTGTEIEVVQKDLDAFGYPSEGDESGGRFILRKKGFLEPEIYAAGRVVTGAGVLAESKKGKVDKAEYEFPVVEVEELKLWEPYNYYRYGYPPYSYYDPFWQPYGGYYPNHYYFHGPYYYPYRYW